MGLRAALAAWLGPETNAAEQQANRGDVQRHLRPGKCLKELPKNLLNLFAALVQISCFIDRFTLRKEYSGDVFGLSTVVCFHHVHRLLANCLLVGIRVSRLFFRG